MSEIENKNESIIDQLKSTTDALANWSNSVPISQEAYDQVCKDRDALRAKVHELVEIAAVEGMKEKIDLIFEETEVANVPREKLNKVYIFLLKQNVKLKEKLESAIPLTDAMIKDAEYIKGNQGFDDNTHGAPYVYPDNDFIEAAKRLATLILEGKS